MNLPDILEIHETHVGLRRAVNQDSMLVQLAQNEEQWQTKGSLFMVADGMGGHKGGEKASQIAVQQVSLVVGKMLAMGHDKALRRALLDANQEIHKCGKGNHEFFNMGTTASILLLNGKGAWVAHVGDSRVYRIREGMVEQLTYDHSYIWEVARIHNITPEDAAKKGILSNKITRCLGPEPEVLVDLEGPHEILLGDTYLVCSDGLSNKVTDEEMGLICSQMEPKEAGAFLIDLANSRGGPDNITVVIAKVPGKSEEHAPMVRPTMNRPSIVDRLLKWSWIPFLIIGLLIISVSLSFYYNQIMSFEPKFFGLIMIGTSFFVASVLAFYFSEMKNRTQLNPMESQTVGLRIHRRALFNVLTQMEKILLGLEALIVGLERQKTTNPQWNNMLTKARTLLKENNTKDSIKMVGKVLHEAILMVQNAKKQPQLFN